MNNSMRVLHLSVGLSLLLGAAQAQIRTIPKEGLPGLSQEVVEFEIEHNYRRENQLGGTLPAEPGTRPNSTNPQVLDGIWIMGRTYSINADGGFTLAGEGLPGMAAATPGARAQAAAAPPPVAAMGGAAQPGGGRANRVQCVPGSPFNMGRPSRILQTDQVIYIFNNGNGSADSRRRIVMNGELPVNPTPIYSGYSVGRWEGGTLIVETTGLKPSAGGGGPGGPSLSYTSSSIVTERIKKIEGGLKLENIVSVKDPATGQATQTRLVSFYRPDLQYVEAPCEEYSDPFEGQYNAPTGADAFIVPVASPGK